LTPNDEQKIYKVFCFEEIDRVKMQALRQIGQNLKKQETISFDNYSSSQAFSFKKPDRERMKASIKPRALQDISTTCRCTQE